MLLSWSLAPWVACEVAGAVLATQYNACPGLLTADIPCFDEDNSTLVKFVDRHNGWGLTALHLATYKGSSSTGRHHLVNTPCTDCSVVQSPRTRHRHAHWS